MMMMTRLGALDSRGRLLIDISDHTHCTIRLCSRFATPIRDVRRQQVWSSALVSHWRSISHFFRLAYSSSLQRFDSPQVFRFPDESSAYSSCFGTQVSGMRLTCQAQLSCDLTMCASMLVVYACLRMLALVTQSWTPWTALSMRCWNCSTIFTWRNIIMTHVSQPYIRVVRITASLTSILVAVLKPLSPKKRSFSLLHAKVVHQILC